MPEDSGKKKKNGWEPFLVDPKKMENGSEGGNTVQRDICYITTFPVLDYTCDHICSSPFSPSH